jgi:glucosylceramidase
MKIGFWVSHSFFIPFYPLVALKKIPVSGGIIITPPIITNTKTDVDLWLTQPDQSVLFKKQSLSLLFENGNYNTNVIEVDSTQTYQTIDGFGYTLTGGSATAYQFIDTKC